jgi:hypothetical protein
MSATRPTTTRPTTTTAALDSTPPAAVWEIVIPNWRPAAFNELRRAGIWGAARLKKTDLDFVNLYCRLLGRVPEAQTLRRVTLIVTLPPKQRQWDIDALQKSTLDALVGSRMLRSDHGKWAQWGGVEYRRGAQLSTTIRLEDLP